MAHKDNLASIQCLRALAALAVLIFHEGSIEKQYSTGYNFIPDWGQYGVDLFFVISGFIMTYISMDNFGNVRAGLFFLLKRALRIYPVYWQFSLLVLLMLYAKPGWVDPVFVTKNSDIVRSFLLLPQTQFPLMLVGWTLLFEMYFYLVFCVAFILPKQYVPVAFRLWAVAVFGIVCCHTYLHIIGSLPVPAPDATPMNISPLLLEFMLGCGVAWGVRQGRLVNPVCCLGIALLWYVLAFNLLHVQDFGSDSSAFRVSACAVPSALIVYAFISAERLQSFLFPRWLCRIGDASYSIYLSHSVILFPLGRMWQQLHMDGTLTHGIFLICLFGIAVLAGITNFHFIENPLSVWFHRRVNKIMTNNE
jgi:peptidoglycan/LPS O-acetylase OafA/YrhL